MKSLRSTVAALAGAALVVAGHSTPSAIAQMETMSEPAAEQAPAEALESIPDTPIEGPTLEEVESDATSAAGNAASPFGLQETDQSPYILVAQPTSRLGGRQRYGLMIIEQKRPEPLCYSTEGSNPTQVNVLLLNFDFSGICGKATDTNGYLLRAADQDIKFDPVLEKKDDVLVLYATPRRAAGPNAERFVIGQTDGIAANGFTQIFLKPGWRLARQTYNGDVTGRTYIANEMTLAALSGQDIAIEPGGGDQSGGTPTPTPTPAPASFPDVRGDIYANEINRAVQLGFIAGFAEDNTFRPRASLTREQVVSMVIDGLGINAQAAVSANPYPDVAANRWSASKIEQAKTLGLISGYRDGSFRPAQEVTRGELMAIMRRAAEYRSSSQNLSENQTPQTFGDTQGHWAQDVISNMSGYCGIATPLNETGSNFAPNQAAQRNYAAAAMVRLLDCSSTATAQ